MDGKWPIREICEKHDDRVQHHRASFWTVVTNYGYVLFVGRFFCKSIIICVEMLKNVQIFIKYIKSYKFMYCY